MITFSYKFNVTGPIDEVFDLISDVEKYNEWVPSNSMVFVDTAITSNHRKGPGVTFVDNIRFGGKTVGKVVAYDPPALFMIKQKTTFLLPFFEANFRYQLSHDEKLTQVTHTATAQPFGIFKSVTPILRRFITKERTATCHYILNKFANMP